MPRRKMPPDEQDTSKVLEAIKVAHQNPRRLTAKEEKEFLARRAKGNIRKAPGTIVKERRGKIVYRVAGKAGADLAELPVGWELKKQRRNIDANISKVFRRAPAPKLGVQARQAKSEQLIAKILVLAKKYEKLGRDRASRIAIELKISAAYVRRVILKRT